MDKETESLWQGARGRLNSQIAEASRGISYTVRTGCRVNSACERPMCCSDSAHCSSAQRIECEHPIAQGLKSYFCPVCTTQAH